MGMGRREDASQGAKILPQVQQGGALTTTMVGQRRDEEEEVRGKVPTQERDGRARGRETDPEGAKQSLRGRLPLHSKRRSLRKAAVRSSHHGRGQGALKERRMGELGGAEVEAREKSQVGGQGRDQQARGSQRDPVAGQGVRGGDREAEARGDQEGPEADPAVGQPDQEVGQKADQRRSPSGGLGVNRRKSPRNHDGQDHPRGHPRILQHRKARRRRRGSQDQGAPQRGQEGRNERQKP